MTNFLAFSSLILHSLAEEEVEGVQILTQTRPYTTEEPAAFDKRAPPVQQRPLWLLCNSSCL